MKNGRGTLSKKSIVDSIIELYQTGFRTISFWGSIISDIKPELIEELKSMIIKEITLKAKGRDYILQKSLDKEQIEKKVNQFIQKLSMQTCLSI